MYVISATLPAAVSATMPVPPYKQLSMPPASSRQQLLTLARLMVGDHQRVKRRLGIWLRPDLCALVNFLYFIDSSKPLAFSLKTDRQTGKHH